MHEHVFVLDSEILRNYPEDWGSEEQRVRDAVTRMNELKAAGVDTIVDLTVTGLGRYIPRIQLIAAQTSLNIVVATGLYTYRDLPFYFRYRNANGTDALTDMFVRDIVDGIAGTRIRAGILKCTTDQAGVTPDIDRLLRAIAKAHRITGVPISTHTHAGSRVGLDQQGIFQEEGVDLSRVVIGHCGDTKDLEYLEELIGNGSYIGMDRFGIDTILPFEDRVNTVASMCARGHAARMVLSHDAACFNHWIPEQRLLEVLPRWNYLHIHKDVIPALLGKGVTGEQIRTMLVDNPRRIFERQGTY